MNLLPRISSLLLLSFLFLLSTTSVKAQEEKRPAIADFHITIQNTPNGIALTSSKGSAWVTLEFTLPYDKPQTINEYGMADPVKGLENGSYLFTITRTQSGIKLKGLQGTAWIDLGFSIPSSKAQSIDQLGMIIH
jgi:hypothetical protein